MRSGRVLLALGLAAAVALAAFGPARAEGDRYRFSPPPLSLKKEPAKSEKAKLASKEKTKAVAERQKASEARKAQPSVPVPTVAEVVSSGNNGELRSTVEQQTGLFGGLFGSPASRLLPQTEALDGVLEQTQKGRKFAVKDEFVPQTVAFSGYQRGTIVIDTGKRFLYLVETPTSARRYAIAVGREGLEFKGTAKVGDKQEWPRWIPTLDMQKREPKKYGQYKDGMPGGPANPLGARAIYLYQGKKDTHIRIHGTNQPQTIGTNSSNGCFRMINEHVMDLYGRVRVGTEVVVL